MADGHLIEVGDALGKVGQVVQAEVVPRIEAETILAGSLGGGDIGGDSGLAVLGIACGIGLGIELHAVGTYLGSILHHLHVGVYKHRGAYACLIEGGHHLGEELLMSHGVPTMVRGELVGSIGHQGHLGRLHLQHQLDELLAGVALDIELGV